MNNKNPKTANPIAQTQMRQVKIIVVTHISNKYLFPKPSALLLKYKYSHLSKIAEECVVIYSWDKQVSSSNWQLVYLELSSG